jgi:succinyl-diaminopimelate desuccinylase
MPGEAQVLVDVRTTPAQKHQAIIASLKTLAQNVARSVRKHYKQYNDLLGLQERHELAVQVDILTDRPCTLTEVTEPIVQAAAWATQTVSGLPPVYGGVPGATDGTFLWSMKNIPIVTMGAGDRQVPHQIDEWVDLEQLVVTAKIYALTALYYLYQPSA